MATLVTNQNKVPGKPTATAIKSQLAMGAPAAWTRVTIVQAIRDRSSIVSLIKRLRSKDAGIAVDAAAMLGSLPSDAEAVDAMIAVVRNWENYFHFSVRVAATRSLARLGEVRATDALIAATRDISAEASEAAVIALSVLGSPRALTMLDAVAANRSGFYLPQVSAAAKAAALKIRAGAKASV